MTHYVIIKYKNKGEQVEYPTKTKLSIKSERLSMDTDNIDLPIHLFPPSIPNHKELLEDREEINRKRVLDNMYKQSNIFYNFNNINIAA